ncbi:glycoside hydrolase family 9 protein [Halococcoides cellulosivorans]|uniref:Glycoside hydrolase family 9 n=1 Tax=Halococcoides cellulosivorans TaxID=1679096 RepID=A0A2R4X2P9_9EURY|nr:glycoside hydrolase family 9 protein [Halococcoides cellulosivorans]AWB28070.1 glycoside hydrolase family 9 [Halococcoides cellulosivorans]
MTDNMQSSDRSGIDRRTFVRTTGAGLGALAIGGSAVTPVAGMEGYNVAEALQKSLYFYDANMCGPGVREESRLDWRGDCHTTDTAVPLDAAVEEGGTTLSSGFIDEYSDVLDPEGTGTVDLAGGYHDAGDHVKFGLPAFYTASTLGWAYYEFPDAFEDTETDDHIRHHLRRYAEYILGNTFVADGEVVAFAYQVSNGGDGFDHNYWGPAELQDPETSPRPAYFATADNPASDRAGEAAAALAVVSLAFEDRDPEFATECVETARKLYDFGDEYRGRPDTAAPYYGSTSDADDLAWAALWLHEATGEDQYLDDVIGTDASGSYTGHLSAILSTESDDWNNHWVHCWENVWGGVFLRLGAITDDQKWWDFAHQNLAFWSGGDIEHKSGGGSYITTTPAGFSWLSEWGSARYNAAAQLSALVYDKYNDHDGFVEWAKGQMRYIMGSNPFDYSLIVGFTDDYASHPHHDTAHGALTGDPTDPVEHRHTLWGALVGGPDVSDNHVDETDDWKLNEVTSDYNAAFVGALAGFYERFGSDDPLPVSEFPPEGRDEDAFWVEAAVDRNDGNRIDYKAYLISELFHPARGVDGLSFRYYFDVSEMSGTVDDVTFDVTYDQVGSQEGHSVAVSDPKPTDEDGLYYVEFDYSGHAFRGRKEISFAIAAYGVDGWDPAASPSHEGIGSEVDVVETLPVYYDGDQVAGREPGQTSTPENSLRPPAPATVSTDGNGTSVMVEWSSVADADEYLVELDDRVVTTTTETSATIGGLDTGQTYEIGVIAADGPWWSYPATDLVVGGDEGDPLPDGPTWPNAPTDPDGDGLYEDLSGDGTLNFPDVNRLFQNADSSVAQDNLEYYDFTGDGTLDQQDVLALFEMV